MTNTPTPAPTSAPAPEVPPQIAFNEVRQKLLELERIKAAGGTIDLALAQTLTNRAADLIAQIQTSTTGPKKKVETADGNLKEPKKARAPKAPRPGIMSADDF